MESIEYNLKKSIPKFCKYFDTKKFEKILNEFYKFKSNVKTHDLEFNNTKLVWSKLLKSI